MTFTTTLLIIVNIIMGTYSFSKKPQRKNRDNRYIILSARVLCLFSGISIALFTLLEHFGSTSSAWAQPLTVACFFIGLPVLAFWLPLCSSIASIMFVVYFIVIHSVNYGELANVTQS
ncbi:MAG: hypothetical protein NTV30_08295, partial [Chloroflexi bacterium]|nr:hypothetical protein [Chloroflexota bacterium]